MTRHCAGSTCLTTRWLGKCECPCTECVATTAQAVKGVVNEIGPTTLDHRLARDQAQRLDREERRFAMANGMNLLAVSAVKAAFVAATPGTVEHDRYKAFVDDLKKPDPVADAYRDLKMSAEQLEESMSNGDRDARLACCKAVIADAMLLLERIKNP